MKENCRMSTYLLGVDIGTSSCKTAVFDPDGKVIAQAERNSET